MKLAEVLEGYSVAAVTAMLHRWDPGAAKRPGAKSQRISALADILAAPPVVAGARWTTAEEAVLAVLWRMKDRRIGLLAAECRALGIAEVDGAIRSLVACGVVLARQWDYGPKLDVDVILDRQDAALLFAPGFAEPPAPPGPAPLHLATVPADRVREVRPARGGETAAWVLALASLAARKKLRVNKDGELSSSAQNTIEKDLALSWQAELWALQAGLSSGLLEERAGLLRASDVSLARLGLGGVLAMLYAGLLKSGWRDDFDVERPIQLSWAIKPEGVREARPLLHGLLARLDTAEWVRLDDLVDVALYVDPVLGFRGGERPYGGYQAPEYPASKLAQRELARGAYAQAAWRLGLVDVGNTSDTWYQPIPVLSDYSYNKDFRDESRSARPGDDRPRWTPPPCDLCVRLTPLGRRILGLTTEEPPVTAVKGFHVGADFEIVAPVAGSSPSLLFLLDVAGVALPFGPSDPVRRWKLDRERWLAALQGGLDGASLLADLATALGRPLPDNVTASIAGWSSNYGGTTLLSGHDLVAYADRAARDAAAAKLPRAVAIDDRWLLVPKGAVDGRVTDYGGAPARTLEVAPDGLVTLDATDDLLVASELDALTEPSREGRRLTAASLKGRRADHVLSWLAARARSPIPPATQVAIRGWCGEVPPARAETVEVLQFASAELAAAVAARVEIARHVAGVLPGGVLVLRAGSREKVLEALGSIGIGAEEGLRFEAR